MRIIGWRTLACAVGLAASACGRHGSEGGGDAAAALPSVDVVTREVVREDAPVFEEVVGTVRPARRADVSAKLSGNILELEATPGTRVKRGDVIARLDAGEIESALDRARAASDRADRDLGRYTDLLKSGAVTQSDFDKIEAGQRMAAATVDETKKQLGNALIAAPFDGVVTRKFMDVGDLATPGRPIFSIESEGGLELEIDVAESLAGELRIGQSFEVGIGAIAALTRGEVREIAPSADVVSRTFLVKLGLPEIDELRAGQFGRAYLPRGVRSVIRVPASSVVERGQIDLVWVADQGRARLRIVRAGRRDADRIEIIAGLSDDDVIIDHPPAGLKDGQGIHVRKDDGEQA